MPQDKPKIPLGAFQLIVTEPPFVVILMGAPALEEIKQARTGDEATPALLLTNTITDSAKLPVGTEGKVTDPADAERETPYCSVASYLSTHVPQDADAKASPALKGPDPKTVIAPAVVRSNEEDKSTA